MRTLALLLGLSFGCAPPCRPVSGPAPIVACDVIRARQPLRCSASLAGAGTRPERLSGRCEVAVGDGGVSFFIEGEACEALPLPGPAEGVRCDVPPLEPRVWRIGEVRAHLPDDGGVATPLP